MSTLYLDYQLNTEKILWKAKLRYNKKLYHSNLYENILDCIMEIRNQISTDINSKLYFSVVDTKKFKSYVIYKFIKNDKILNKKKVIFQIDQSCKLECKAIKKKFNITPQNNFKLFVFIDKFIKGKFMNDYDSYIKSSWIKLYIEFKDENEIYDESSEEMLLDVGPSDENW